MNKNYPRGRGRKRSLLAAALIAIIAAAAAVIAAIPSALAAGSLSARPTANVATTIEKTFAGLVGDKLEWTITIHQPSGLTQQQEFFMTDDDSSAVLAASTRCLTGAQPWYCSPHSDELTATATVQTDLPAGFDQCKGGNGTNTVRLFSTANFTTAPNELSKASADWTVPPASGCCTAAGQVAAQQVANCRNVTIIKQVINNPSDTTQFHVSLNTSKLPGTISGDGLHVIHTTINGDVTNTFSEDTPLPGGYQFLFATDNANCTVESDATQGVAVQNDYVLQKGVTGDVTICFVNFEDPKLSITKTANPAGPVGVGNPIGFDITLTNSGGAMGDMLVTDTLDQSSNLNWSLVPPVAGCSITGSPGSQQLSCNFTNFSGSQVIHLSSPTVPAVCGLIKNTATWQEPSVFQRAASAQTLQIPNDSASASVTVECGGTLTVTKLTETNGIVDGSSSALPWAFTVHSNTCAYTSASTATVSGVATFTNLPPCNDYQVTESGGLNGYTAIGSTPSSGSIVVTSGHTTNVTYLNVRTVASGCPVGQTCRPFVPPPQSPPVTLATPTPTVAPPTPTAVPPTATPTRVSVVLGEKTPGVTPAPPSTGNGSAGAGSELINVAVALLGLLAAAGGLATLAAAKGRRG